MYAWFATDTNSGQLIWAMLTLAPGSRITTPMAIACPSVAAALPGTRPEDEPAAPPGPAVASDGGSAATRWNCRSQHTMFTPAAAIFLQARRTALNWPFMAKTALAETFSGTSLRRWGPRVLLCGGCPGCSGVCATKRAGLCTSFCAGGGMRRRHKR